MRAQCSVSGMLTIETMLFIPLALVSAAIVAQVAWLFFQEACFEQALAQSAMRLEQEGVCSGGAEEIHEAVLAHWTPIDAEKLVVQNARIEERTAREENGTDSELDRRTYLIEQTSSVIRFLSVEADAAYTIDPIVPIPAFEPVTIERSLRRSVISTSRFEAS